MVKSDITNIPVWIKMHEIPLVGYTDDGLSAIASKLVNLLCLIPIRAICVLTLGAVRVSQEL